MAGFVSGDGSFDIKTTRSNTNKLGKRVQLRFSIGLNIRDKELLIYLVNYLGLNEVSSIGNKYIYFTKNSAILQITNYSVIVEKIIPSFDKYEIKGKKSLDFYDIKKVAILIRNKEHLTEQGYNKIEIIKQGMNSNRV